MTVEREGWWNVHEDDCAGLPRSDMRLWQYGGILLTKNRLRAKLKKGLSSHSRLSKPVTILFGRDLLSDATPGTQPFDLEILCSQITRSSSS